MTKKPSTKLAGKASVKSSTSPKKAPTKGAKKKKTSAAPLYEVPSTSEIPSPITFPEETKRPLSHRVAMVLGVLALVGGVLFYTNKSLFVVATVNGTPIFRWELSKVLMDQFGKQMVDSMITERLIANAAAQANISITQKDIEAKEQEIVKSFGGKVTVEELLKFQGMTKASFDNQIKTQLIVSQIVGKDIKISDGDISAYIEKNKDTMVATDEAKMKDEAKNTLFNQKVSEKVQPWFTELRTKANIQTFLP